MSKSEIIRLRGHHLRVILGFLMGLNPKNCHSVFNEYGGKESFLKVYELLFRMIRVWGENMKVKIVCSFDSACDLCIRKKIDCSGKPRAEDQGVLRILGLRVGRIYSAEYILQILSTDLKERRLLNREHYENFQWINYLRFSKRLKRMVLGHYYDGKWVPYKPLISFDLGDEKPDGTFLLDPKGLPLAI